MTRTVVKIFLSKLSFRQLYAIGKSPLFSSSVRGQFVYTEFQSFKWSARFLGIQFCQTWLIFTLYNCNYAAHRWCLVSGDEYWFRMVGFIYCLEDSTQKCMLFTAVLPKRLCKTHTPCIHFYLRDKIHRSHQGLIKRSRLSAYSLLTLSPFPLFLHWRLPLPFCLLFIFPSSSISWAMLAVSISFCNLDFLGCHVFNIRSGHIQLFRERLSEEMRTRQSWKVIWDMINTLFLIL